MTRPSGAPTPSPRAHTVAQVAAMWGVSTTFVYELINAGGLPGAFKLGNKLWRIPPLALDAYELRAQAGHDDTAEGEREIAPAPLPDAANIARLIRQPHRP